ncbi:hypothetical protein FPCIR_12632, partial [Fusarium pseudocircinatum]
VPTRAGEEAHHVAKEEGRVAGADGTEGIDSAEAVDMELGHMVGVEAGGGVVGHGVDVKIASGKAAAAAVDVGGEDVELTAEEAEEDGTSGDVDSGAVEAEEDAGVVGRASYKSICSDKCGVALRRNPLGVRPEPKSEEKRNKTRPDVGLEGRRKRQKAKPPKGEADDTK